MRFHPRRHGAYNFSARAASAFTNAYFKSKKTQTNTTANSNTGTGSIVVIIIFIFIMIICAISSALN